MFLFKYLEVLDEAFIWIYVYIYERERSICREGNISINNSTFSGCLHSKSVVLHAHLSPLENMPQYQPLR